MEERFTFLTHLNDDLVAEIKEVSSEGEIPKGTEILREGQYIKVIPIVQDGLIKVYTRREGRELLLYYIEPGESCIMSFAAGLTNNPSKIYAVTEEDTRALLVPVDSVEGWIARYPDFNTLYFEQYSRRYADMLDTIHQVLFSRMDQRLLEYLQEKVRITGKNPIKLSHRQIANELGSAREVISRVIKKLEAEGEVAQVSEGIEVRTR